MEHKTLLFFAIELKLKLKFQFTKKIAKTAISSGSRKPASDREQNNVFEVTFS